MSLIAIAAAVLLSPSVKSDIVYAVRGQDQLKLDLHLPAGPGPHPCVVVMHGGSWMVGKRGDMTSMCQAMAQNGLAAATIDYRLAPKHKFPAAIIDTRTAIRWLKGNAESLGLDQKRFTSAGASAGAHLALMTAMEDPPKAKDGIFVSQSSRTRAVLNVFGPTLLTKDFPEATVNLLSPIIIGKPANEAQLELNHYSPLKFLTKDDPPIFTIHGDADTIVPVRQATRLDEKMKELRLKHTMVIISEMGHELDAENEQVLDALREAIDFLKANSR
jgi:acetyl esterase/lipase